MMAAILELPLEIIDQICCQLDRTELAALLLACKGLRGYIEPHLYKTVTWGAPLVDRILNVDDDVRTDKADLLLRTILQKPQLGRYVHHLRFFGRKNVRIGHDFNTFTAKEIELGRSRIQEICQSGSAVDLSAVVPPRLVDFWKTQLQGGLLNAVLGLLLSMLPNLQSLVLDFDHIPDTDPPFSFVGATLALVPWQYHDLQNIEFSVRNTLRQTHYHQTSLDPFAISSIFRLPAVKAIQLSHLGLESFKWHSPRRPICDSIQSLRCQSSLLNEQNLGLWLAAAVNIRSLTYEIELERDLVEDFDNTRMRWDGLGTALSYARASLRILRLYVSYDDRQGEPGAWFGFQVASTIGSLQAFEQLQKLTIPFTFLLGNDVQRSPAKLGSFLPQTLVEFCIFDDALALDDWGWSVSQRNEVLVEFLSEHAQYIPLLATFAVALANVLEDDTSAELLEYVMRINERYRFDAVEQVCKALGLDFTIRHINLNGRPWT